MCVCVYVCESKNVSCSVVTPGTVACFSVHGNLQGRILDWVTIPNPGIKSRSPALQADSLQSEPPGKPICICIWAFQVALVGESACQYRRHKRHGFDPWVRKIPWSRAWQPTPVNGQRSLPNYSPQRAKELDMTEATQPACIHIYSGRYRNTFSDSFPLQVIAKY